MYDAMEGRGILMAAWATASTAFGARCLLTAAE
jgi:hypothetical protein